MAGNTLKIDDAQWQAEHDASIMASYQEILNDKPRMRRAIKAAERQVKDLNKRATAMSNVVKAGSSRKKK